MRTLGVVILLLLSFVVAQAQNWPQWRGPNLNGVSDEKNLPVKWTTEENVAWKLFLWCVDKTKGEVLWKRPLGDGNVKMRKQNSRGSSQICADRKNQS